MLISVITIARNEESTIARTLRSVAIQSFDDYEIVLIDGGSTDRTVRVAEDLSPPQLRVFVEPPRGISHAMNRGIALSRGEIILHLNAGDDLADPGVLEKVADGYSRSRWKWAIGSANIIDPQAERVLRRLEVTSFDYNVLKWMNTVPHQSTFVTRGIFDRYGAFSERFRICMDYEFWLRIGREAPPFILPFTVSNMRTGGTSSHFTACYIERCRARMLHTDTGRFRDRLGDLLRYGSLCLDHTAQRICSPAVYEKCLALKNRILPFGKRERLQKSRVLREHQGPQASS